MRKVKIKKTFKLTASVEFSVENPTTNKKKFKEIVRKTLSREV